MLEGSPYLLHGLWSAHLYDVAVFAEVVLRQVNERRWKGQGKAVEMSRKGRWKVKESQGNAVEVQGRSKKGQERPRKGGER